MITDTDIKKLAKMLPLLRKTLGWSAEQLGEEIGVTRQTINNIERGHTMLSKTQYIAIRSVFDTEMEAHPDETEMLKVLLDAFIDHPDSYSQDGKIEIMKKANLLAPAIASDPRIRKEASAEWIKILTGIGVITTAALTGLIIGFWRHK